MMNINFEEILYNYEKRHDDNVRIADARKQEIYEAIPRVRQIDETIAANTLQASRLRIRKQFVDIDKLHEDNKALMDEKTSLISAAGYPDDYLKPIFTCPICKDTGYVGTERCTCLKQIIIDELYNQSNIKDILKKENFDTFSLEYYSKDTDGTHNHSPYTNAKNIVDKSLKFVQDFENNRPGILIYGDTGLGKTFISNCIAKALLDKGHTVLYLSSINLFENILAEVIMNNGRDEKNKIIYNYIFNCDLLIIDDLGTELTNSFTQSQLFEIINTRNNKSLSTLISTNLSIRQLQERYTERTMSRMVADFLVFNFYGDNIRYAKRKKSIADKMSQSEK